MLLLTDLTSASDDKSIGIEYCQIENVAFASALQLEAARARPALSCFNYNAMPRLKSLNLSIAVL